MKNQICRCISFLLKDVILCPKASLIYSPSAHMLWEHQSSGGIDSSGMVWAPAKSPVTLRPSVWDWGWNSLSFPGQFKKGSWCGSFSPSSAFTEVSHWLSIALTPWILFLRCQVKHLRLVQRSPLLFRTFPAILWLSSPLHFNFWNLTVTAWVPRAKQINE